MYSALLMPHQNVLNIVLQKYFIIDWQHCSAGIPKDSIDALIFQGLNNHFCSTHLARHIHLQFNLIAAVQQPS